MHPAYTRMVHPSRTDIVGVPKNRGTCNGGRHNKDSNQIIVGFIVFGMPFPIISETRFRVWGRFSEASPRDRKVSRSTGRTL